jgi:hypothetical protein
MALFRSLILSVNVMYNLKAEISGFLFRLVHFVGFPNQKLGIWESLHIVRFRNLHCQSRMSTQQRFCSDIALT